MQPDEELLGLYRIGRFVTNRKKMETLGIIKEKKKLSIGSRTTLALHAMAATVFTLAHSEMVN